MTAAAPLCKDCRHYIEGASATVDRCAKRLISGQTIHLVRGDPKAYGFCETSREDMHCGAEGRWFEKREA